MAINILSTQPTDTDLQNYNKEYVWIQLNLGTDYVQTDLTDTLDQITVFYNSIATTSVSYLKIPTLSIIITHDANTIDLSE